MFLKDKIAPVENYCFMLKCSLVRLELLKTVSYRVLYFCAQHKNIRLFFSKIFKGDKSLQRLKQYQVNQPPGKVPILGNLRIMLLQVTIILF